MKSNFNSQIKLYSFKIVIYASYTLCFITSCCAMHNYKCLVLRWYRRYWLKPISWYTSDEPVISCSQTNHQAEEGSTVDVVCNVQSNPSANITWTMSGSVTANQITGPTSGIDIIEEVWCLIVNEYIYTQYVHQVSCAVFEYNVDLVLVFNHQSHVTMKGFWI